jgi:hypothetical protein
MTFQTYHNHTQHIDLLTDLQQVVVSMNIIFDLTGVLFANYVTTEVQPSHAGAYALQLINPTRIFHLMADCIKQGHRLFIISNLNKDWYQFLQEDPQAAQLFTYFEDIVLADCIGIKKPDPRIFNHLIQKNFLSPDECIFIDDTPINLKGAGQAGIKKGILCKNFDLIKVRKSLQNHGVL